MEFFIMLLLGIFSCPFAIYANFPHCNVLPSLGLATAAIIIVIIGIKFRTHWAGKSLITAGTLLWSLVGIVEIGRWM